MSEPKDGITNLVQALLKGPSIDDSNVASQPATDDDQHAVAQIIRSDAVELAGFLTGQGKTPNTEVVLEVVKKNVREYPWLGRLSPTYVSTKNVDGPPVWMLHIILGEEYTSIDDRRSDMCEGGWAIKSVDGVGLTGEGKLVNVPHWQNPGRGHYDKRGHYVKHESPLSIFTPLHSGEEADDERLAPINEIDPTIASYAQIPVIEWRKRLAYFAVATVQDKYYSPEWEAHEIPEISID